MASYISVPRDLSKVKTKVFMNLIKRQILCFGAGALIGVPVFFLLKSSGNLSLAALGMMAVMLPLFFLAMYEKDGQPLEVVAKHFYEAKFKRPKTRPYKTKNYYALLVQQADVEMEVNRIVQNGKSKSGSPAQGDLLLRQRHVNAVFYGKRGGGAAAEYRIDRRKQRPCQTLAEGIWPLRVQGHAPVHPVRRTEAAPCHCLRHLFRPQDIDTR